MIDVQALRQLKAQLLAKFSDSRLDSVMRCTIELNSRMRSTAGRANYTQNKIILNNRLLSDNPDHLEQTFVHELAHLISYALHGRAGTGHGPNWKRVMRTLGYSPDRTHSLDTSGLRRVHSVKGIARCSCRTYNLKARRFNKILRGAKYRCLLCMTHLEIVDDLRK